jgi:hypothetical protein
MAGVGYEWLTGALDRLHGIAPHEVTEVLSAHRRWPRRAKDDLAGLQVLTIWARTAQGRPLIVATRRLDGWDRQIIGAREMTPGERAQFEVWEAGHHE